LGFFLAIGTVLVIQRAGNARQESAELEIPDFDLKWARMDGPLMRKDPTYVIAHIRNWSDAWDPDW
jgi:hypothetical protein